MIVKKNKLLIAGIIALSFLSQACKTEISGDNWLGALYTPSVIDMDGLEGVLANDTAFTRPFILQGDTNFSDAAIKNVYKESRAYWFRKEGLHPNAQLLLDALQQADTEGFDAENYYLPQLGDLLKNVAKASDTSLRNAEILLTYSYLKFLKHILLGQLDPSLIDKNWQNINDTT